MAASHNVEAAPLEQPACVALKNEHHDLLTADMKADIARGPDWAKAHLASEQLEKIARVIEIEEQLAFRCSGMKPAEPVAMKSLTPKKAKTASPQQSSESRTKTRRAATRRSSGPRAVKRREKKKSGAASSDVYRPPPPSLGYRPGGYSD